MIEKSNLKILLILGNLFDFRMYFSNMDISLTTQTVSPLKILMHLPVMISCLADFEIIKFRDEKFLNIGLCYFFYIRRILA